MRKRNGAVVAATAIAQIDELDEPTEAIPRRYLQYGFHFPRLSLEHYHSIAHVAITTNLIRQIGRFMRKNVIKPH